MTVKLYDDHPYEHSFTAIVLKCLKNDNGLYDIILDRTLFFPEEGGQSPDRGSLFFSDSETEVSDVQIDKEGTIRHSVSVPVPEGITVKGKIDWEHRFSNMQMHTGEHVFSGLVNKKFGYDNVGFHLSDNEMTVDYNGALSAEDIHFLEEEANKAVISCIPVSCRYPSPEELASIDYRSKKELSGAVRIVSIPGIDTCACCAPHVHTTGEVGLIKVINFQSHRGGVRIWLLCGSRAINEFSMLQEACGIVSREYSVPVSPGSFAAAFEKRNASVMKLRERLSSLQEMLLRKQIEESDPGSADIILFVEGLDEVKKREVLNEQVTLRSGYCSIFDGNDADGYSFIIASSSLNCNEPVKKLREQFGAKGGGKPVMAQGFVKTDSENIRDLLTQ